MAREQKVRTAAVTRTPTLADISWEGDAHAVLKGWPIGVRQDFGHSLYEMQAGRPAILNVRPMPSIGDGVFELKTADESKWYRLVYLARIADVIYVLDCFERDTRKTEKKDIRNAAARLAQVKRRLTEKRRMKSTNNAISKPGHITKGSVLDDLGFSRAEAVEAKVKADLWRELVGHITPLGLTQKELAHRLGVHQPEVSHLLNGRLSKFSAGTLIQYAVKLDLGVHVKLTVPKARKPVPKRVAKTHARKAAMLAGG